MTTTATIHDQVAEFLAAAGVTYAVRLVGETTCDNDWKCDEWRVTFKANRIDFTTPFYTGTGHRKATPWNVGLHGPKPRPGTLSYENWELGFKPVAPTAATVLASLVMDGATIDESFADWCANFGYEEDSRKALQTYTDCCETGRKLRMLFTHPQRDALAAMLQDF
jgi:hypothetical protein